MPARIVVAHPRLAESFRGSVSAWIYADERLDEFDAVAQALGKETALVRPEQFQIRAAKLLPQFMLWADEQIPLDDSVEWLLTPCHRNPFGSNLFLHLVWLDILARHGDGEGPVVVFTDASGLAEALCQLCRDCGWEFSWRGQPYFFVRRGQTVLRACAKLTYDTLRALTGVLAARVFLGEKQFDRLRDVELLIDAYLYPDSLAPDGSFRDTHLPGLLEWCTEKGIHVAIYPFPVQIPLRRLPRLFRRMQASAVPMLPFELLIGLDDIFKSAAFCLGYALRRVACSRFEGLNVSPLVAGERFKACTAGLLPLLLLEAPRRLDLKGIRPQSMFEWFENQPIDRANAIGFGRAGCRVIALRLYALYPMFSSLYTSDRQARAGACPPQAWVGGAAMEGQLRRHDGQTRYRRVPALRYGHLHSERERQVEGSTLLLLLTHSREESLAILACVLPVLRAVPDLFSSVIIKPHGDFSGQRLHLEFAERWPWAESVAWLQWESRPVDDLVCDARMMVSAGSSAALEAICRGVPVILIGRQAGLDMNPLTDVDCRLWTVAYDSNDVARTIGAWSPAHPVPFAERLALGKAVRAEYFEPASGAGMEAFDPRHEQWLGKVAA